MVRPVDMQAVLAQTTTGEKISPMHESQDMNMRHFALLAEEARAQKKSSVHNPEHSKRPGDREPHHEHKRNSEKGGEHTESEDSCDPEKAAGSVGKLIDITV